MAKKRRRRRRLKKGPVLILLLIVIGLISFCIFKIYISTSKYLFFKGLDKTYDNLNSHYSYLINNYVPYINNNYYNNTDTSIVVETSDIKDTIKFKGDIYLADSYYFDLDVNANSVDYKLELLTRENKLYYKIDNSKYYYMDFVNNSFSNTDSYSKLLSVLIDSLSDNIGSSDLKKENYKVDINSKIYNTKKVTLNLTESKLKEVMISFYNEVKADEELLNCLLSSSRFIDKEALIDYINIAISGYEEELKNVSNDIYLTYSVYLYKSKPIKNEIILGDYQFAYIEHSDYIEFSYKETDSDYSYIKFNNGNINIFIYGIGYGNGTYDDSSFNIEFVDYDKKSLGTVSYSIDNNNDKYNVSLLLNIDLELLDISLDSNSIIEVNKAIPDVDVSESEINSNMTENDVESLEKLLTVIKDIIAF